MQKSPGISKIKEHFHLLNLKKKMHMAKSNSKTSTIMIVTFLLFAYLLIGQYLKVRFYVSLIISQYILNR